MTAEKQYGDSTPEINRSFKDSQEAALRRILRQAVRKAGFSKAHRDVTLAILNYWLHHKSSGKGYMHPSRKVIAKKSEVSVRTVATVLDNLRAARVLLPVSRLGGGRSFATRYKLDELALMQFCGLDIRQIIDAMTPVKCAKLHGKTHSESVQPLHTVLNDVSTDLIQESENIVALRFGGAA